MSSQPYVYKPPARRVSQNPPTTFNAPTTQGTITNVVTKQTGGNSIKPSQRFTSVRQQGLKTTKVSDLGSSSLFKGLDNLSSTTAHNRPQRNTNVQKVQEKRQQATTINKVPIIKQQQQQSITTQNRFERKQPLKQTADQQPLISSRLRGVQKQQDSQSIISINNQQPIIRKPLSRTTKYQPIQQSKPQLATKQQQQIPSSSSYTYKPVIRRTSTPITQANKLQTKTTTIRNQSSILSRQQQTAIQVSATPYSKSTIYQKNKQQRQQPSAMDLNLQVNTQTKIFKLQTKNNDIRGQSVEKIGTSKSISSSSNLVSPIKLTQKIQNKTQQQQTISPSQPIKKYTYQRPKTKAQLVRQNQLLKQQSKQQQQNKYAIENQSRSTILHTNNKQHKEQQIIQNKSTIIDNKKPIGRYQYNVCRKSRQQLLDESKPTQLMNKQPHIIVSVQHSSSTLSHDSNTASTPQVNNTESTPHDSNTASTPQVNNTASTYTYQPYKRSQKSSIINTSSQIHPKQQHKQQKQQQKSAQTNSLIESRKTNQYSYQRSSVTNNNNRAFISSSRASKVVQQQPKQQQVQQQTNNRQQIPLIAYSLLNILLRKKQSSNIRYSLTKIKQQSINNVKRQKLLQSLVKKSIPLTQSYLTHVQLQAFNVLKNNLLSHLTINSQSLSSRVPISSKVSTTTTRRQLKQQQQLNKVREAMKKPLCYALSQLVNNKFKSIFKQKLSQYNPSIIQQKLSPLSIALHKLFTNTSTNHINYSFSKIKFNYHHIPKSHDQDILPLCQNKNKKLTKPQIIKYLNSIIPIQPITTSNINRVSLLSTSNKPNKLNKLNKQSKTHLITSSNIESKKITQLKQSIKKLQKQIKQQQKNNQNQQSQINNKKTQLIKQINDMKKQNQIRKQQNNQFKQKLKKYQVISFSDRKLQYGGEYQHQHGGQYNDQLGGYEMHQLVTPIKQSSSILNQQRLIKKQGDNNSNRYLDVLCKIYVSNLLKSQLKTGTQRENIQTMDGFLQSCKQGQGSLLIRDSLEYVLNKIDNSVNENSGQQRQRLQRLRVLIQERVLIEENCQLKGKIEQYEREMILSQSNQYEQQQSEEKKSIQQLNSMRVLVSNYIKERYLWQYIIKSIQST